MFSVPEAIKRISVRIALTKVATDTSGIFSLQRAKDSSCIAVVLYKAFVFVCNDNNYECFL